MIKLLFEFSLQVFDQSFDYVSVASNWKSGSLMNNYVAYGQSLCLLVHALISTTHLIWKFHQNEECYRFLWGTNFRKIVTFVVCILGFGGSAINVDIFINPNKDNDAFLWQKQKLKISVDLLHVLFESLPQTIIQSGLLLYALR